MFSSNSSYASVGSELLLSALKPEIFCNIYNNFIYKLQFKILYNKNYAHMHVPPLISELPWVKLPELYAISGDSLTVLIELTYHHY